LIEQKIYGKMKDPKTYLIETPRLKLRELSEDDSLQFFQLNNDPEVIKYTGDPPFPSVDSAREFLAGYDQYTRYGYGRWAVISKETGDFLGWCGLKYVPALRETDLGFRFFRCYWGQGYATEAAIACIKYGFEKLGMTRIAGRAMMTNKASILVLEKAGLRFVEEREFEEHPGGYFVVER
jgi:RimJ/RimL family protein N-acetyltransferase